MLMPELFRSIHGHADAIASELMSDLRRNPRTPYLHRVSQDEFHRRALDLYSNLSRWIASPNEDEIVRVYGALGRDRFREGVPASELVSALVLTKRHLCDFITRNDVIETTLELYQEGELFDMIHRFFDQAIIHALRGYEAEMALREPARV